MNFRFLNWYTQAIGATIGLMACIYSYLQGYMYVYSNIGNNFDNMSFGGVISSYLLVPLCTISLFIAFIKGYYDFKDLENNYIELTNKLIIILTVIVGFSGTTIYFIAPTIFLLFNMFSSKITDYKTNIESNKTSDIYTNQATLTVDEVMEQEIQDNTITFSPISYSSDNSQYDTDINEENLEDDNVLYLKKVDTAKEMIGKSMGKEFIIDMTGLTNEQLIEIENEMNILLESTDC